MKRKKKRKKRKTKERPPDKRRSERRRCTIPVEFSVYAAKIRKGKSVLKDASAGGLNIVMTRAPVVDTVIAIKGNNKRLAKYVNFGSIILDPQSNPIVRVVHVRYDKDKRRYNIGVRFLMRPTAAEH